MKKSLRRSLQALLLVLVLLAGFAFGVTSAPTADAALPGFGTDAGVKCITYCCELQPWKCITCCEGQACPDLMCP